MKWESKLVYDFLKFNIETLGINYLCFSHMETVQSSGREPQLISSTIVSFMDDKYKNPMSKIRFIVIGGKVKVQGEIVLEIPVLLDCCHVYRGLIDIKRDFTNIRVIIDDSYIEKALGGNSLYDRLREIT